MKLCKDCKHFTYGVTQYGFTRCNHPSAKMSNDPVWGNTLMLTAEECRTPNYCGPAGDWFEVAGG